MKRAADWVRFVFVSPEFLYAVFVLALWLVVPASVSAIGRRFHGGLNAIDLVYAIPGSCLIASLTWAHAVLFPEEALKKTLKTWPDYQRLVDRVKYALGLMFLCSIGATVTRLLEVETSDTSRGFLTLLFCGVATIPAVSLYNASLQIKIITDEFACPNTNG